MGIDNLQELRDVTIVAFTIAGTVFFLLASLVGILAVLTLMMTMRTVAQLRGSLQPTLEGLRETVDNLRGTAGFVSENAVSPIIRVYGTYAGLRRFFGVMSGLFRRGRRR